MSLIVPEGYITTDVAIEEMLDRDVGYSSQFKEWEKSGYSMKRDRGALLENIDARKTALVANLEGAVKAGEIEALIVIISGVKSVPHPLPTSVWKQITGSMSFNRGYVLGVAIEKAKQREQFEDQPICFRRSDWNAWLAASEHQSRPPNTMHAPPGGASAGRVGHMAAIVRPQPKRGPVSAWIKKEYPDGIPVGIKRAVVADSCAKALGLRSLSVKTLQRAISSK